MAIKKENFQCDVELDSWMVLYLWFDYIPQRFEFSNRNIVIIKENKFLGLLGNYIIIVLVFLVYYSIKCGVYFCSRMRRLIEEIRYAMLLLLLFKKLSLFRRKKRLNLLYLKLNLPQFTQCTLLHCLNTI